MKKPKFTFKTEKSKGPYSSFFPNTNHIKLNKQGIGTIEDKKPHIIRLKVIKDDILEDGNKNCEWKWIRLTKKSESLQEAKDFLNKYIEEILKKYKLALNN